MRRKLKRRTILTARILLRTKAMPKDADFTFVMGGTNDYGHGDASLGIVGDLVRDTFCAAFADLARYMRDNFGKEKVCFILPLPRYDQDNPYGDGSKTRPQGSLSAYIAAEKAILEKFELPYLDLSDAFPVPECAASTTFTVDGLHPNDAGHSLIAERLLAYLEEKICSQNENAGILEIFRSFQIGGIAILRKRVERSSRLFSMPVKPRFVSVRS